MLLPSNETNVEIKKISTINQSINQSINFFILVNYNNNTCNIDTEIK